MLSLRDVKFGYNGRAIIGCSRLDISGGDVVGVTGGNGSGKSTFLKGVVGLAETIQGQVFLAGASLATLRTSGRIRRGLAFHPQSGKVFGDLSVRDNLRVGFGLRYKDTRARFSTGLAEVVDRFSHLQDILDRLGRLLSGGERQLVGIGRCILQSPRLLVLDEPSAALDNRNKEEVARIILELARKEGLAALIAEHDKSFLRAINAKTWWIQCSKLTANHSGGSLLCVSQTR